MIEMLQRLVCGKKENKREMQEAIYILKDIIETELHGGKEGALKEYANRILKNARLKFDLL